MSQSPNLKLPYLDANQNQKTVTHNAALTILDALVNCQVQSAALATPPASPADGQCWIIASGGTGAWATKDFNIAAWQDGVWTIYPPTKGMLAYNDATAGLIVWTGSIWIPVASGGGGGSNQFTDIGIGTVPDPTNPLSATLNNALFNALGSGSSGTGDVRVKLNKQAAGNTASFLFQDGFSGRAEIGLTGDDSFHFKVSPDGSTFRDALVLDAATGGAQLLSLNGGALAGNRNRLINGNFAINQRGHASGAVLAAGAYGLDRWKAGSGGATLTFTAAKPDTSVTITAGTLVQVIEDANIEGGSYTLSWTGTATARVYQGSATGSYAASPITVTGLGAGVNTTIDFSTGSLGKVQFEPGLKATPFERRPIGAEMALCDRYFQSSYDIGVAPGTASQFNGAIVFVSYTASNFGLFYVILKTRLRTAPTVTPYSPNSGASGKFYNQTTNSDVAAVSFGFGQTGGQVFVNNVSLPASTQLQVQYTCSAEL